MASETQLGRSLSVISTASPTFYSQMFDGGVHPTMYSAELQIVYGFKMSKTAALDTHHSNFSHVHVHVHVLRVWLVAILRRTNAPTPSK